MDGLNVHQHLAGSIITAIPDFSPRSRDAFEERYNRTSFLFHHELHEHELFSWTSLIALGNRHPAREPYTYWARRRIRCSRPSCATFKSDFSLW